MITASSLSSPLSLSSSLSSTPIPTPTPSTSSTPSPSPTPNPTGPQIIIDPSFEDGRGSAASPWIQNPSRYTASTAGRMNTDARTGIYSYQIPPVNGGTVVHWVEQTITAVVGQSYDVSLWAVITSDMGACYTLNYVNSARPATAVLTRSTSYQQFSVRYPGSFFTKASNTFTVVFQCNGARVGAKAFVDNVTMTQVIS
ncbi:hypothetical protein E8E11_000180 [Didymella keratinophila]|nr:hypothetical protein E8E11_000180 [Didymella keratinophila]